MSNDSALSVLQQVFGYPAFRGGQDQAVAAILAGRDALVLLPTGAGKSLCYQVPAVVLHQRGQGTTIVVSPLIALMQDQVAALKGRGVPAEALNSHQDADEQRAVIRAFAAGELALLYVSPERAALDSFKRLLDRAKVALLAIDEAHCLSQWGHDFRPEYLRLGELRPLAHAPTIALTATATPRVMAEIALRLKLQDPQQVQGDFRRPNLSFAVQPLRTDAARMAALVQALDAEGLRSRVGAGRAIVYCGTRKKAETVSKQLRTLGFAAGHYHAGRTKLARERAQNAFDQGRTRVLVATNAFGMGIDYPDVRLIVHFQAPGSLEAYYQEAGRAGRDGAPARCLLYFGAADLITQRRLQSGATSPEQEHHRAEALRAVETYALEEHCRELQLVAHFTGADDLPECGRCDVCLDPHGDRPVEAAPVAAPVEALPAAAAAMVLEAAGHLERPVGRSNLAKALRGARTQAVKKLGLERLPEHGRLKAFDEKAIVAEIDRLLQVGQLERRGHRYPTVWLKGRPTLDRVRSTRPRANAKPRSSIVNALEGYRRRMARSLKWKPYMVFQRRVITAIDRQRPQTKAELARIPGLGLIKIERFGEDILSLIRSHD